jgi:molybdopterin molybdotransferase
MKSIPDNLSPEEAWKRLCSFPRMSAASISLENAVDHILAAPLQATEEVPAGKRSFRDGFAVRSADVSRIPANLKLIAEIPMGAFPSVAIGPGETMAIPTGGFLPEGADAVVMQEDTEREGDRILIKRNTQSEENVQQQGEDFRKGELIFSANHRLRPQDLAAIAMFGITYVSVIRKPAVRVISTGNELVPFQSKEKEPGQIRETNSLALVAAAHQFGFAAKSGGIVTDDLSFQRNAMEVGLHDADVILFSGGSSVGERDFTLEVIQSFPESRIIFHGLSIRPGHPTIFASIGSRWVFGLPGHPVSSLVVFYQFVLPFLFHLSGEEVDFSDFGRTKFRTGTAKLVESIKPLKTKTDYVRLRLKKHGHDWMAIPIPGKSASLSSLSNADAFTIVPPGEKIIERDETVEFILFP